MKGYQRADLTLLGQKSTLTPIHGFSRDDSGNDGEMSMEQDRSAVYAALSLKTFETSTLESSMASLMSTRAGETLRQIEKGDERELPFITESGGMTHLREYSMSNNDHTHRTRTNDEAEYLDVMKTGSVAPNKMERMDDSQIKTMMILDEHKLQMKFGFQLPDWAENQFSSSSIQTGENTTRFSTKRNWDDTIISDRFSRPYPSDANTEEDQDMDTPWVDFDSKLTAQPVQNLSGVNTTLDENTSIHSPRRHHAHELLVSCAKQDSIFINCTISEDRSGNQESVTSTRLAALSLRRKVKLHVPIEDLSNDNFQIQPPSETNSKRITSNPPDEIFGEVRPIRLYLGNLARTVKFNFETRF